MDLGLGRQDPPLLFSQAQRQASEFFFCDCLEKNSRSGNFALILARLSVIFEASFSLPKPSVTPFQLAVSP